MSGGRDFWSSRRAAVRAEEEAARAAAAASAAEAERAEIEARDDAEILAELDLPDPDQLQPGDDICAFMSKAVPDRLRRRALRRLWRLNPVLANVDGLVDYGEDFTDSATVIENLQTAYQVGKGMLAHVEEMARQAEARDAPEPVEDAPEDAEDPPEIAELAPQDTATPDPDPAFSPDTADPQDDAPAPPMPRRMRFAFDTDTPRSA